MPSVPPLPPAPVEAREAKPRARNRRATEQALVAAASRVFAERGYENATTRAIAEAAGCSEGLIQRYFGGKEGLLMASLRDPRFEAEIVAFYERPLCASLLEEAQESIATAARTMSERADAIRIGFSRVLIDTPTAGNFSRNVHKPQVDALLGARFARYAAAGMVDATLDIPAAIELLTAINFQVGFLLPQIKRMPAEDVRRLQQRMAEFFARAIAPTDTTSPP